MITKITHSIIPEWIDPAPYISGNYKESDVISAINSDDPGPAGLAAMLSSEADGLIETMAQKAKSLTASNFGNTISLYSPLYLSNYCTGGCEYCGFAADRKFKRSKLSFAEVKKELSAIKKLGIEDVLLLTGERTPEADFAYLYECVKIACSVFHNVVVEAFPMHEKEYSALVKVGCTGLTLYQETYDPAAYAGYHRWGPKKDYLARLETPSLALAAGMRTAGIGALLGLSDPVFDAVSLLRHALYLRKKYWRAGVSISFPRIRPQEGGFKAPYVVDDRFLAKLIFAFRICLPDTPLVLSTREPAWFRDGMAGVGVSRMSVASKTTVGGYAGNKDDEVGQFDVDDARGKGEFCRMLSRHKLDPVFKNADSVYR